MRDSKGRFIHGSTPKNERDPATGKFLPLKHEPEIQLVPTEEETVVTPSVDTTEKPSEVKPPVEKPKESSIVEHPHRTFRRWDELQDK